MKPRIFISSSKEHLDLARAVQENLDNDFETIVWEQDTFGLSQYPIEALLNELNKSNYGVFIFAPSDVALIREKEFSVPRDNIVLELGMFIGKLGREKTFFIVPRGVNDLHLPSDLLGLIAGDYERNRTDRSIIAALGPVCNKIRKSIQQKLNYSKQDHSLIKIGLFSDFTEDFKKLFIDASEIILYFIHSRRWRENNLDLIRIYLEKEKSTLTVFLPDITNKELMHSLISHFDDGPSIPSLIVDAYRFFIQLSKEYINKVEIRLFNLYPTYSFYKYNDKIIVAFYPTVAIRKSVPTIFLSTDSAIGTFFLNDINKLFEDYNKTTLLELEKTIEHSHIK